LFNNSLGPCAAVIKHVFMVFGIVDKNAVLLFAAADAASADNGSHE
jgi:hypothetical protein